MKLPLVPQNVFLVSIFLQGICLVALLGAGVIQKEWVGDWFRSFAIGYQPFYGLEWEEIRVRFLIENLFSAFILLCSTALLHYWRDISDTGIKIRTQFVSLVIYNVSAPDICYRCLHTRLGRSDVLPAKPSSAGSGD